MEYRVIILSPLIISILFFASCGDSSTGPELQPGVVSGTVTATDGRSGIDGALLKLSAEDTLAQETYSDSDGNFSFDRVEPGQYEVTITLPQGFRESGPTNKIVQVDGGVNIEFEGEPIEEETITIQQGKEDTLFTGSGAFIAVDASNTSSNVEVTIEEMEESDLAEDVVTKPVRVWIRPPGSTEGSSSVAKRMTQSARTNSTASTNITLGQKVNTNTFSNGAAWFFDVKTEEESLRLYAKANAETYVDSTTDQQINYLSHTFTLPLNANIDISLGLNDYWDETCSDTLRTLDPMPGDKGVKPLILIHGLHIRDAHCENFEDNTPLDLTDNNTTDEYFDILVDKLQKNTAFDNQYKIYTYRYPTNTHIITASKTLWERMREQNIQRPVILAHSMGGLVARALMQDKGNDKVAGLITLGTPHEGTPMVDLGVNNGTVIDGRLIPNTDGLRDLALNSDLILELMSAKGDPRKIFTLGGAVKNLSSISGNNWGFVKNAFVYKTGVEFMESLDYESDGMVPVSSAVPKWSGLQTVLEGHDHTEISNGNDLGTSISRSVIEQILPTLSVLAECEPPPKRIESNDFNLSGSVARKSGQEVQVTLNSIKIDGEIIEDLSKENFMIIENGCVRPISNFSTEDVGVDIAFVQDMSGSMGSAINGVRSSVINFANDLSDRGIDAQIGSIGYSGPGDIPSTPDPSPCEYLGPFQNLISAEGFRNHVSNNWRATGGCDVPENALEGIEYAHQNISWREGAARVFINITDVSHHTDETNCNGEGPCTDQSLTSITNLVGEKSIIHSVADDEKEIRTAGGGGDPWELAEKTGGEQLTLPGNGFVDLTKIGITDVIGEASKFTFKSASPQKAIHTLRIRVEIDGKVAELAPDLVRYKKINSGLNH